MQCPHPITLKSGQVVPCGKCPVCKANDRQEWVFRLKQECKYSPFTLFFTLTYDDDHIPPGYNVCKRDVQLFLKRFRKNFKSKEIRYYIVSEYGDHTYRPHYHGIFFFQHVPDDLRIIFDQITSAWQNGFCKFGEIILARIVYVTKYCLKRHDIPSGREKNFRLVSKMNGGLGFSYMDDMGCFHVDSGQYNFAFADGQRCRMPRYYKTLFQKNNPLYRSIQDKALNDSLDRQIIENERKFKEFKKKFKNDEFAAMTAFNQKERDSQLRAEDLIIKHCKKQEL